MARLRRKSPIGNESSDDSSFRRGKSRSGDTAIADLRSSPRKKMAKAYCEDVPSECDESETEAKLQPKTTPNAQSRRKQIRLAPLNTLSLSKPLDHRISPAKSRTQRSIISASNRGSAKTLGPGATEQTLPDEISGFRDESARVETEESLWCGSDSSSEDSDESLPSARKFINVNTRTKAQQAEIANSPTNSQGSRLFGEREVLDSKKLVHVFQQPHDARNVASVSSRPTSSSDKENHAAFLRFSPPRVYSPPKCLAQDRPVTPPQSPSKSRLQSPSKTKTRLPTPPIRQSFDAFWNADTINDWNDAYSPQKVLKSPKKLKFLKQDGQSSPTSSTRKCQSPSKTAQAEREAKKTFESHKRRIAEDFLSELDRTVTAGTINELAEATGGVQFIWSKTLNSTAGRANWRKETTKTRKMDGSQEATHKHFASIELAEKVIDDEHRLLNVIAHEFCHLANFMISGIKDQPHGRQFKDWGRKCTKAFQDRGVEVTTKHSYQIDYKYIWQCSNEDCGAEFKRHSKSIDPKRHTCGSCRNKLVQIKPVPRKDAGSVNGYAAYVKANFAEVKRSMPRASQKEVMEEMGRKYRKDRADGVLFEKTDQAADSKGSQAAGELDQVARVLEFVTLRDD